MGSFLQACCLTNQTIRESEEVYIIPIIENTKAFKTGEEVYTGLSESVYNTDLFTPMGFIFTGQYADYGRYDVDFSKTDNKLMMDKFITLLQQDATDIEQGENKYHDVPFKTSEINTEDYSQAWDYIHEAIWEGRLFVNHPYRGIGDMHKKLQTKVHYFIVSKQHADTLLNMHEEIKVSYFYDDAHKAYVAMSPEERVKAYMSQIKELASTMDQSSTYMKIWKLDGTKYMHQFLDSTYVYYSWVALDFIDLYKEVEETELSKLYVAVRTLSDLTSAMSLCHVIYRPVHYGTQDYGNTIGIRFCEFMARVNEKNITDFIDREFEYGESEKELSKVDAIVKMKEEINSGYY